MKLEGKVALVTGAGRGIGAAIALALAREGADLAVNYASSEAGAQAVAQEIRSLGRRAFAVRADVSRSPDVATMVDQVVSQLQRVDILVNNAGILDLHLFGDMTEDAWDRTMAVNLKSVYLCSHAVLDVMKRQGGGRIINISSIAGIWGGVNGTAAYAASKAGVIGLTKALARELAPAIQVNAIAPGTVDTGILDAVPPDTLKRLIDMTPMKRLGATDDIAKAVLFLAADAEFMTGQVMVVDGGRIAH